MTIQECIDRVDNLYPNQYSEETKVDWLSRLDYRIFNDVILTHEPERPPIPPEEIKAESTANPLDIDTYPLPPIKPEFEPYTVKNMTKQLIVGFPFDELYISYLQMKIDEANKETAQYNANATFFNHYYDEFAKDYNRHHLPINKARYEMWRS